MRHLPPAHAHPTTARWNGHRSHRIGLRPARRPSAQLISDGVVASYIHQISERHRRMDSEEAWVGPTGVLAPCGG